MSSSKSSREIALMRLVDQTCDQFETALHAGQNPQIETFLAKIDFSGREMLLGELIKIELEWLSQTGLTIIPDAYRQRFPNDAATVRTALEDWQHGTGMKPLSAGNPDESSVPGLVQVNANLPRRFGRFTLQRLLGTGGFGSVYLAHDTRLGRPVAIKIPHSSSEADSQRRFLTEARAAAKLRHANIVTVYDSDVIDGSLFIVSEFVDGRDLAQVIKSGTPTLRQLVGWLRDAARGLAYAHSEGVIHRDIKPSNLLIGSKGEVYLSDFGLARRIDDQSSLTASGTILGTPAYMAPEQAAGITSSVGPASDQYSLGVVLFQVLTGRLPFRGNVQQLLQRVIREQPPRPRELNPNVPLQLEAICLRTLAKNPAHRYPDLLAFADDLDGWLEGKPVSVVPTVGWRAALSKLIHNRTAVMIASALAIVAPLGVFIVMLQLRGNNPQPDARNRPPPAQAVVADDAAHPNNENRVAKKSQLETIPHRNGQGALDSQQEALTAAISSRHSWEFSIPQASGGATRASAVFAKGESDSNITTLLLHDLDDASRKSLWSGRTNRSPAARLPRAPAEARSTLVLEFQSGDPTLLAGARQITFVLNEKDQLAWQAHRGLVTLAKAADSVKFPTLASAIVQLRNATTPGRVFNGTLQFPGEASREVRLTFTDVRDSGRYVRAILQSADSEFIMAPFEGIIDFDPATVWGGSPIRLVRQAQAMGFSNDWSIFASPWQKPEIHLMLGQDEQLLGSVSNAKLKLSPAASISPFIPRKQQWSKAIVSGSVWTGSIRYGEIPPRPIRVTVAETRDGLGYVRLLVENATDPHYFCVYEGALNHADDVIDGFALGMHQKTKSPKMIGDGPLQREGLFGYGAELRHAMRLSPDGTTLFCRTACGEELTLKKSPEAVVRKLDHDSSIAQWRSVCIPNQEWKGLLRNTKFNQNTAIRLQFLAPPDELGRIAVRVSLAAQSRVQMVYSGTLSTEGDLDPNAFALKLTKQNAGLGESILFGTATDAKLHLRLSTDGGSLIGMAGQGDWTEFMELTK